MVAGKEKQIVHNLASSTLIPIHIGTLKLRLATGLRLVCHLHPILPAGRSDCTDGFHLHCTHVYINNCHSVHKSHLLMSSTNIRGFHTRGNTFLHEIKEDMYHRSGSQMKGKTQDNCSITPTLLQILCYFCFLQDMSPGGSGNSEIS